MTVYTKTGDKGFTGTLSGRRVKKTHNYIQINGHIDELTSHLGLVKLVGDSDTVKEINDLQNRLIQVMGYISGEFKGSLLLNNDVDYFERQIDYMSERYVNPKAFILPGQCEISARLDVARAVARRCERHLIQILDEGRFDQQQLISYFNRMSDYLYTMARMLEFRELVKHKILNKNGDTQNIFSSNKLNLALARVLSEMIMKKASEMSIKVVVTIVDSAGLPIITEKMDDAFPISFDLSRKKAYTAAVVKMSTTELKELTKQGGDFEGLEDMIMEDIVALGGGYPLVNNNKVVGAVGVSGGSTAQDSGLAKYGASEFTRITEKGWKYE